MAPIAIAVSAIERERTMIPMSTSTTVVVRIATTVAHHQRTDRG
jgi:hypothetical protein